jgi:hypothetical protein
MDKRIVAISNGEKEEIGSVTESLKAGGLNFETIRLTRGADAQVPGRHFGPSDTGRTHNDLRSGNDTIPEGLLQRLVYPEGALGGVGLSD